MGFLQNRIIRTTLAVVVVIGGLWLITAGSGNSLFVSVANTVTYPFRMLGIGVSNSSTKSAEELEEENKQLKDEIAVLSGQLADYYNVKRENAQLRKYYNIKAENENFELMPASVISRDPCENFYSFTADKGTSSGIEINDPVLTENGLIGFVSHADLTSCVITTILSPDIQVSCIDSVTNDVGVINGKAFLCEQGLTSLSLIPSENKIAVGDIITTSGMGNVYPKGIVIGKVEEIAFDDFDISQYAVIKPYEDIKEISDVVILTDYANDNN